MATLEQQAIDQASKVRDVWRRAMAEYTGDVWLSTQEESALSALRSLDGPITAWEGRGISAARAGKAPAGNGWPGWTKAGETYAAESIKFGQLGMELLLGDIKSTAAEAPKEAAKTVRKVAKTIGCAAGDLTAPVLSQLRLPLIVVGVVAVLIAAAQLGLLRRAA